MLWVRQRVFVILALTVLTFCVVYWTITSRSPLHPALTFAGLCPAKDVNTDFLRERLVHLQSILKRENDSEAAWQQTVELIEIIDGELGEGDLVPVTDISQEVTLSSFITNTTAPLEVCPEQWIGPKVDHPFFFKSWKILDCYNVIPFEKVLTVILFIPSEKKDEACPLKIQRVLAGLNSLYPKVPVLVSGIPENCLSVNDSLHVRWIANSKASRPGENWNNLVKAVSTPYVLVGRDMDDFLWTADLERQVRMISYNQDVSVAGGAVRNFTGHWRVGCWQTTMHNYILEYQEGYYTSMNSCMFCDHLTGPYIARTKLVKSVKFHESLPAAVLFEDWFWRIKQASHRVVNCPDVMYLASDPVAVRKSESRTPWLALVRKWGLNRVVIPSGRTFSYSCSEAGLSCQGISSLTNSFLIPICCVEQFGAAIGAFNDFCRQHQLRYELEAGSVLGVVKMNDMMPWDLDGDISFYAANMSFFKQNAFRFKEKGILFKEFQSKEKQRGYFSIYTPDLYSEMWGEPVLSHDLPLGKPFRSVPTQVELHGHWVYAPHSPGTYARNRYGIEIFRHAQSWSQLGMKTSWAPYKSGHFKKCKTPKHHACLDHFSTDGNIQFQIPN